MFDEGPSAIRMPYINIGEAARLLRTTRRVRGAPLRTIQELAGHHALTMTERYLHLSPSAKVEAMALLAGTLEK